MLLGTGLETCAKIPTGTNTAMLNRYLKQSDKWKYILGSRRIASASNVFASICCLSVLTLHPQQERLTEYPEVERPQPSMYNLRNGNIYNYKQTDKQT